MPYIQLAMERSKKDWMKTGKFDLNKTDLIAYSHGQYFTLGDYVGKFGYSVQKKK